MSGAGPGVRCPFSPSLLATLCLSLAAGCEADGYGLRLHLYADDAGALGEGSAVIVQVRDLQSPADGVRVGLLLEDGVSNGEALDVDVTLHGGGEYHAHLIATAPTGRFVATRCYHIGGVYDSEVLLVGPLDDDDLDGDTWPAQETCHERGSSEPGCTDQCPPVRAVDCNERDTDIHPGATERCGDNVDQDCNTVDATCDGEDETGGFGDL